MIHRHPDACGARGAAATDAGSPSVAAPSCARPSCPERASADGLCARHADEDARAQLAPLSAEAIPGALSGLLDFVRAARPRLRADASDREAEVHALHAERCAAVEAAFLDAGASYVSLALRPRDERVARLLWWRVAAAVAGELAADTAGAERVGRGIARAQRRCRVWSARTSQVSGLFADLGA